MVITTCRHLFPPFYDYGHCMVACRIENRTNSTTISTRQSGLGEDTWIQVKPLSTRKYSWDDPYGQKAIDVSIQKGDIACVLCVDLENPIRSYTSFSEHGLKFSIVEVSDTKILKFTDSLRKEEVYGSPGSELIDHQASALKENEIEPDAKPLELIVELGVVGISLIDHKPRELLYLHLQKVFISYMTGYGSGTTSRYGLQLTFCFINILSRHVHVQKSPFSSLCKRNAFHHWGDKGMLRYT